MKKSLLAIPVLIFVAGSLSCESTRMETTARTFENPIVLPDAPDPTIWDGEDGWFYLTSTEHRVMRSRDFVHWEPTGHQVLTERDFELARAEKYSVWAPDVVKIGSRWCLYASLWNNKKDSKIVVYTSARPEGPFTNGHTVTHSKTTGIWDTIDADVLRDPETGKLWMFFGSIGRIHRVELTPDGQAVAPGSNYVHVAGLSKYIPGTLQLNPAAGPQRKHVFEGSYVYHRNGWWYLFASSGEYQNATYALVVGRSRSLNGIFADRQGRPMSEGFAETILSSSGGDEFYGPGHNGEIITRPSGRTYMFYHCHWADKIKPACRAAMLQEIFWDAEGWPYFGNGGKPQKVVSLP